MADWGYAATAVISMSEGVGLREESKSDDDSSLTTARPMAAILMPAPDAQSWRSNQFQPVLHGAIPRVGGGAAGTRLLLRESYTVEIVRIISLYDHHRIP